jgi:DNA-binding GntR family transcriptional regulator
MSPAQPITQDRIYREIKAKIVSGQFGITDKLEAPTLARLHDASATPVREALFRLVGEGLVQSAPNGGFQIQPLTRDSIKDMYSLTQTLLLVSLSHACREPEPPLPVTLARNVIEGGTAVDNVEALFQAVFRMAGNRMIVETGARLNDRLSPVRRIEEHIFKDIDAERGVLLRLLQDQDYGRLRRAIHAYHRRRIAKVPQLLTELTMQSFP